MGNQGFSVVDPVVEGVEVRQRRNPCAVANGLPSPLPDPPRLLTRPEHTGHAPGGSGNREARPWLSADTSPGCLTSTPHGRVVLSDPTTERPCCMRQGYRLIAYPAARRRLIPAGIQNTVRSIDKIMGTSCPPSRSGRRDGGTTGFCEFEMVSPLRCLTGHVLKCQRA